MQELVNVATKKLKFEYSEAISAVNECVKNNNYHLNTKETILQACRIAQRYGVSFYDSMIISSALESNCSLLYSEDMSDGQIIEDKLKILNPFK